MTNADQDWIVPGAKVWYSPFGQQVHFAAVVDSTTRLRKGTLIVALRDLDPSYARWRGMPGKTTISAVLVSNLSPRVEESVS